ncbi:MAG TPA: UDP-N-acetylglucosamine 2-epimerase (non-hydrolyzing), partial [Sphingomonadaceae bacterium]|nr:UDP-N-acetylglucosamine 2-epimerase (non-hydrolyzing) [Sphingomonadaceae bacterium]
MAAKLLILFGTRPEAIKLLPVIRDLRRRDGVSVRLCATGQHRDLLDQVLAQGGIAPDIDLALMRPDQTLDTLMARLLSGIGSVLDAERPDRVVVQGDTATALAGALAAHHRRIAISHVEAGLRSGNMLHPWPEESYRRMIAVLADQHFAPTRRAADALHREGVAPAAIHVTGNTVIDALLWVRDQIAAQPRLAGGVDAVMARARGRRLILVTTHRRENRGDGTMAIAEALRRIARRDDVVVALPVHPHPRTREAIARTLGANPRIALLPPLDYPHFVRLLGAAYLVLTDSGGVQEEAPALGKPVLVL